MVGKEIVFKAGRILPKGIRNRLTDVVKVKQDKPIIDKEDQAFAYSIFKNDTEELEKLLAKDLSAWKLS